MKELFVTYEAAKKLTELDFNDQCFGCFFNNEDRLWLINNKNVGDGYIDVDFSSNEKDKGISAPLKMQAIFWLMERIGEKDRLYELININICSDLSGSFDNIDISEFGDATIELYEFADLNDAIDYLISLYKNL